MVIDVKDESISEKEVQQYIKHINDNNKGKTIKALKITKADEDYINLEYTFEAPRFDRIRRITGYLVGTVDRFNNAKRAEVNDRVKHYTMSQI